MGSLMILALNMPRSPKSLEDYIALAIVLAILVWIFYDYMVIFFQPRFYIRQQKEAIRALSREKLSENLKEALASFSLEDLSEEIQKLKYFHSLKPWMKEYLQTDSIQQKYLALTLKNYQERLIVTIFREVFPPRCKEDLELLDYKCKHKAREVDFALLSLHATIQENLTQEIIPLLKDMIQQHHQKVQNVRKAIQKDQDALPILGMEIPLPQAAEIISQSGEDFDITGIQVKSLTTLAEYAQPHHWEVFCHLLVKASQGSISNLLDSFSYHPKKGESVPHTFLNHLKSWLEKKRPLNLQNSDLITISEKFAELKKR